MNFLFFSSFLIFFSFLPFCYLFYLCCFLSFFTFPFLSVIFSYSFLPSFFLVSFHGVTNPYLKMSRHQNWFVMRFSCLSACLLAINADQSSSISFKQRLLSPIHETQASKFKPHPIFVSKEYIALSTGTNIAIFLIQFV